MKLTIRNSLRHDLTDQPITPEMSLKKFIFQSCHLAPTVIPMATETRHTHSNNYYEYRERSLKPPPQQLISNAINGDDSLSTAALNYQLADKMQL